MKLYLDFCVSAIGLITSLITAVILFYLEKTTEIAFYSFSLWYIIPVGAGLAGFVAASGYYIGAKIFNVRPSNWYFLHVLAISAGCFFLINFMHYSSIEYEGEKISEYMTFGEFMKVSIESTQISSRRGGDSGELGSMGYAYAALQIVGFAIGGLILFMYLKSLIYCEECRVYFKEKGNQRRFFDDPEEIEKNIEVICDKISDGKAQEAIDHNGTLGRGRMDKKSVLSSNVELKACPKCDSNWMKFFVTKLDGQNWEEIEELTIEGLLEEPVSIKASKKKKAVAATS